MLRVHFTPEDIGRVRMAGEPDPMWETVFTMFRLTRPGQTPIFGPWREQVVPATRRADLDILLPLVRGPYYPDFLTPAEGLQGLPYAIEALLSTPTTRLRQDMLEIFPQLGDLRRNPPRTLVARLGQGSKPLIERDKALIEVGDEPLRGPILLRNLR